MVVPLLVIWPVVTVHLLLVIPLAFLIWWWASHDEPWLWVLGILEACFGVQWALLGIYFLVAYPHHQATVETVMISYAAGVAVIGLVNRWKYQRRYGM